MRKCQWEQPCEGLAKENKENAKIRSMETKTSTQRIEVVTRYVVEAVNEKKKTINSCGRLEGKTSTEDRRCKRGWMEGWTVHWSAPSYPQWYARGRLLSTLCAPDREDIGKVEENVEVLASVIRVAVG